MQRILFSLVAVFTAFTLLLPVTPALAEGGHGHGNTIEGTISAVDTTANTVTITRHFGGSSSLTLNVDTSTRIKRNGATAALTDLQVGDRAEARYDPTSMLASRIEATSAKSKSRQAQGVLAAVDLTAGTITLTPKISARRLGPSLVLNVTTSTLIKRNGASATLADLVVGDRIEARYDPTLMTASMIDAHGSHGDKQAELHGKIAAVDTTANTVTVTPMQGGANIMLTTNTSTMIRRNGATATLADLQVGDMVEARYDPITLLASRINAVHFVMQGEVHGKISAVDTTAGSVTITPFMGGADVTVMTDSSTVIRRNGATATLADLQVGDWAEAMYDPGTMLASKIDALHFVMLTELHGKLSAVDTTAGTVTITPSMGGADVTLTTDGNTMISIDDKPVTLADLVVGSMVEAAYNGTSLLASRIEVDADGH